MAGNSTIALEAPPRQRQLCDIVAAFTRRDGYPPALADIAAAMQISVPATRRLAKAAIRRGMLAQTPGAARSWRVVEEGTSSGVSKKKARGG